MKDTYLMVNGKRIELPETVLNDIRSATKQTVIDEFFSLFKSYYSGAEKDLISIEKGKECYDKWDYLTITLPNCNSDWSYAIFDACKEFCKSNSNRYPTHYNWQNSKKFYIHLEDQE